MKRPPFILFALLLLAAGAAVLFLRFRPGEPTLYNFERVRVGMTVAEVETLLGPGEETWKENMPDVVDGDQCYRWRTRSALRFVSFREGQVTGKWAVKNSTR